MNEDQLIAQIQRRDGTENEVWKLLVETYEEPLMQYLVRRFRKQLGLPGCEDVIQDVWIKVYEAIGRYKNQGSFWGWLCQIAFRTALDAIRGLPKRGEKLDDVQQATVPDTSAVESHDVVSQKETRQRLREAIDQLPEYTFRSGKSVRCIQVIRLRFVDGLTRQETAETLRITVEELRQVEKYILNRIATLLRTSFADSA